MLIVRVELHHAVTGLKTEIARMEIINDGTSYTPRRGNYIARTLKGGSAAALDKRAVQRTGDIECWPRLSKHVWNLVAAALKATGYG